MHRWQFYTAILNNKMLIIIKHKFSFDILIFVYTRGFPISHSIVCSINYNDYKSMIDLAWRPSELSCPTTDISNKDDKFLQHLLVIELALHDINHKIHYHLP